MYEPVGFSLDIFKARYSFTLEESWQEACVRVATQVATLIQASCHNSCSVNAYRALNISNENPTGSYIS